MNPIRKIVNKSQLGHIQVAEVTFGRRSEDHTRSKFYLMASEASQANYCKPREQKLVGGFMSLIVVPSTIGIVVARYRNPQDSHNQFAHPRSSCIFLCGCPSLAHT